MDPSPPAHLDGAWGLEVVSDLPEKVPTCPQSKAESWWHPATKRVAKGTGGHATRKAQKEDSLYRYLGDLLGHIVSLRGPTYAMVKQPAGIGKSRAP